MLYIIIGRANKIKIKKRAFIFTKREHWFLEYRLYCSFLFCDISKIYKQSSTFIPVHNIWAIISPLNSQSNTQ